MVNCTVGPTNWLVFALGAAGPVETLCFLARSSNRYKTNVSYIRSLPQKSSYHLTVDSVCNLRIFTKTVFRESDKLFVRLPNLSVKSSCSLQFQPREVYLHYHLHMHSLLCYICHNVCNILKLTVGHTYILYTHPSHPNIYPQFHHRQPHMRNIGYNLRQTDTMHL